jgi:hypothetical protein
MRRICLRLKAILPSNNLYQIYIRGYPSVINANHSTNAAVDGGLSCFWWRIFAPGNTYILPPVISFRNVLSFVKNINTMINSVFRTWQSQTYKYVICMHPNGWQANMCFIHSNQGLWFCLDYNAAAARAHAAAVLIWINNIAFCFMLCFWHNMTFLCRRAVKPYFMLFPSFLAIFWVVQFPIQIMLVFSTLIFTRVTAYS